MPSNHYKGHILLANTFSLEVAEDLAKYIKKKQLLSCAVDHSSELSTCVSFFIQGKNSELATTVRYGRFNFNTKYLKLFSCARISCFEVNIKDEVINPDLSSCTKFSFYECLPKTYEKYQHGAKAFPKLIEEKEDTEGDVEDFSDKIEEEIARIEHARVHQMAESYKELNDNPE